MSCSSSDRAVAADRIFPFVGALIIAAVSLLLVPVAVCFCAAPNASGAVTASAASNSEISSNPAVQQTLETSCFGCHSNQSTGPWNARIAPSYLFGASGARRALNFSEWHSYDAGRKKAELAAISKVIKDDSMPPWDYNLLHPAAKLSSEERQQLLQWVSHEQNAAPQ